MEQCNTDLADSKNEVAKQLADKTIVNYFQVVKAVVASAVTPEGEQLYPRDWNFHFIGLPVIDEKKQMQAIFDYIGSRTNPRESEGPLQVALCTFAGNRTSHR